MSLKVRRRVRPIVSLSLPNTSIYDLPNEMVEFILGFLPSKDLRSMTRCSKWLQSFSTSRRLRVNSWRLSYSTLEESQRQTKLKTLLFSVTEIRDLERLEAMLSLDPSMSNSELPLPNGGIAYPLEYAFNPLTVDTLLRFGADPNLVLNVGSYSMPTLYVIPTWRIHALTLKEVEDKIQGRERPLPLIIFAYEILINKSFFRLFARYGKTSPKPLMNEDVDITLFALKAGLSDKALWSPKSVYLFLLRLILPKAKAEKALNHYILYSSKTELPLLYLRYGVDLRYTLYLIEIQHLPPRKYRDEAFRRILESIVQAPEDTKGLTPLEIKEYLLSKDIAVWANNTSLYPNLNEDSEFWELKYALDFGSEPQVSNSSNVEWCERYYLQMSTPCFVVEFNKKRYVLCLDYYEGRGFFTLTSLAYFLPRIKVVEIRRGADNEEDLLEQYGGSFYEDQVYLDLKGEIRTLPCKNYMIRMKFTSNMLALQFDDPSYLNGCKALCSILGVEFNIGPMMKVV